LTSTQESTTSIQFELRIVAEDGRVLAQLDGVSLRRVPTQGQATTPVPESPVAAITPSSATRVASEERAPILFQLGSTEASSPPRTLPPGRWLVVCGNDYDLGQRVAASPPFSGREVHMVTYGDAFARVAGGHVIDPSDAVGYQRLLDETTPLAGVVHLAEL